MNDKELKIISKIPQTKQEIDIYAINIRNIFFSGDVSELFLWKNINAMHSLLSKVKDDDKIKKLVVKKRDDIKEKHYENYGAIFDIRETGVKYDYAACGDAEYDEICAEVEKWTNKKKEREEFLKTIKPDQTVFGANGVQIMRWGIVTGKQIGRAHV